MDIGEKIKQLRTEKDMTLEELGNIVGVGKSTVRKWECGMIANMRRDKIAKIAGALGVTPAYLMGWEEIEVSPEVEAMPRDVVTEEIMDVLHGLSDAERDMALSYVRFLAGSSK
ncbi:MAG: helix-turn-helix domain-containing protein [Bacteroidales bacterium]|nr:helix-turn-helix domain-containing protein [Bacteroidales bacterium]